MKQITFIDRFNTKTFARKHLVTCFELVRFMHQLKTREKKKKPYKLLLCTTLYAWRKLKNGKIMLMLHKSLKQLEHILNI
jgi:hypothetical protein